MMILRRRFWSVIIYILAMTMFTFILLITRPPKNFKGDLSSTALPGVDSAIKQQTTVINDSQDAFPGLAIYVLTYKRANSLSRLLKSLLNANYLGSTVVDLYIWVDREPNPEGSIDHMTIEVIRNFSWPFGCLSVQLQPRNAHVVGQWIETWKPYSSSNTSFKGEKCPHIIPLKSLFNETGLGSKTNQTLDEFCRNTYYNNPDEWSQMWNGHYEDIPYPLFLEDDMEVAPNFYIWLKAVIQKQAADTDIYGFTLGRPGLRPLLVAINSSNDNSSHLITTTVNRAPINVHNNNTPFAYKLVGSWGFCPKPMVWSEFVAWYAKCKPGAPGLTTPFKPYVPNLVTTLWYKSFEVKGREKSMWTQWYIYFTWKRGNAYTLYANLPEGATLGGNWKEAGEHYSARYGPNKTILKGELDNPLSGSVWEDAWAGKDNYKLIKLGYDGEIENVVSPLNTSIPLTL